MPQGAEREVLAHEGTLSIRRMRDDLLDYAAMARWLTDPRVLAFYEGRDNPYPLERVREEYGPLVRGEEEDAIPCLLQHNDTPIGYIQYYPVDEASRRAYEVPVVGAVYGIDLFIGEPDLWDQGLGTQAVSAMLGYLFDELAAAAVVIDPQVSNARAIQCYEKSGFRKMKVLPQHEFHEGRHVDTWLMVAVRPNTPVSPPTIDTEPRSAG